jgi:hypothetical protein
MAYNVPLQMYDFAYVIVRYSQGGRCLTLHKTLSHACQLLVHLDGLDMAAAGDSSLACTRAISQSYMARCGRDFPASDRDAADVEAGGPAPFSLGAPVNDEGPAPSFGDEGSLLHSSLEALSAALAGPRRPAQSRRHILIVTQDGRRGQDLLGTTALALGLAHETLDALRAAMGRFVQALLLADAGASASDWSPMVSSGLHAALAAVWGGYEGAITCYPSCETPESKAAAREAFGPALDRWNT